MTSSPGETRPGATPSLADFMAQAIAMELEAAQRYEEFGDAMDMHNNREVAVMFHKLAVIEAKHADQLLAQMGWAELPFQPRIAFEGFEGAETIPVDAVHYLMKPWHVLQLALASEQRAVRFFDHLARTTDDAAVRSAAEEMREEEREHVQLVRAWMEKVEPPPEGWDVDPDPPRYTD
jgi:rubrerythrin